MILLVPFCLLFFFFFFTTTTSSSSLFPCPSSFSSSLPSPTFCFFLQSLSGANCYKWKSSMFEVSLSGTYHINICSYAHCRVLHVHTFRLYNSLTLLFFLYRRSIVDTGPSSISERVISHSVAIKMRNHSRDRHRQRQRLRHWVVKEKLRAHQSRRFVWWRHSRFISLRWRLRRRWKMLSSSSMDRILNSSVQITSELIINCLLWSYL